MYEQYARRAMCSAAYLKPQRDAWDARSMAWLPALDSVYLTWNARVGLKSSRMPGGYGQCNTQCMHPDLPCEISSQQPAAACAHLPCNHMAVSCLCYPRQLTTNRLWKADRVRVRHGPIRQQAGKCALHLASLWTSTSGAIQFTSAHPTRRQWCA